MKNKKRTSAKTIFFTITFLIAVFIIGSPAAALAGSVLNHIYVDQAGGTNSSSTTGSESDPFKSITYAMMKNKETPDPLVLHIKAGIYDADPDKPITEREIFPIELRNGMIIQGDDGAENCIISGKFSLDSQAAMLFGEKLSGIMIRDLTLRDMDRTGGTRKGGGAELIECSGTIQGCVFENNNASSGEGFWLSMPTALNISTFTVADNKFIGNAGEGFYVSGDFTGDVYTNVFRGNNDEGFVVDSDFTGDIYNNTFNGNDDEGFFLNGNFIGDVYNNTFSGNSYEGFQIIDYIGNIYNNVFCGNNQKGFIVDDFTGDIYNNTFSGNKDSGFVADDFTGNIFGNTFSSNSSLNEGGGFKLGYYPGKSPDETIISNNIFLYNSTKITELNGADIYSDQNVIVVNNTFYGTGNIGESSLNITDNAPDSIIRNNIFANFYTAIWEQGALDLSITDNNFYDVSNILHRNNQALENDLEYIEMLLSRFTNNHNWEPGFAGENADTGALSNDPVYDPDTNLTTFTAANKNWTENQWKGAMLNLSIDPSVRQHCPIVANTANQIKIMGNLENSALGTSGSSYTIDNYHLAPGSQNIDAIESAWGTEDFEGDPRPQGVKGDIGADEYSSGETAKIPSIISITPPVTAITSKSAALNGRLNPNGIETTWYYEYGTTNSYGLTTPEVSVGSGSDPIDISADISGLSQGTTYHFRLIAVNSTGTTTGEDQVFTTSNNKAIIVAGGGPSSSNFLWESTKTCANHAFNALLFQGYSKDNIHYLSPENTDADGDGVNDNDTDSTKTDLQNAVTVWADSADKMILFMTGHGGEGTFRLNSGEVLNAEELKTWLDELQATMSGELIFIYDACQSGSFLSSMSGGSNRTLIASASPDEPAYFLDSGQISFSFQFWTNIWFGATVSEAYENSHNMMKNFQTSLAEAIQNSSLIGAKYEIASDFPVIGDVSPEITLNGESSTTIWANGITDANGIQQVWAVITPPGITGSPDKAVTERPTINLLDLEDYGIYEGEYTGFVQPGEYQIDVFAKDKRNVRSPLPKRTRVIQQAAPETVTGDLNADGNVNLTDAIIALKAAAGADVSGQLRSDYTTSGVDVNGNDQAGLEEAVYALINTAG